MKTTDLLLVEPYYEYKKFIEDCKNKSYGEELVLHLHHILPKHLKTGIPDRMNTVYLSVDDHIKAHILLSECFTEGSYERLANIKSAKLLSRNSIKEQKLLEELYKYSLGEGNSFYGKKHKPETIALLREATKNNRTNISYDEYYGDSAEIERDKRSKGTKEVWKNRTKEEVEAIKLKIKQSKSNTDITGGKNPNAKPILVDGVKYDSVSDAKKILNKSRYKLFKEHKIEY